MLARHSLRSPPLSPTTGGPALSLPSSARLHIGRSSSNSSSNSTDGVTLTREERRGEERRGEGDITPRWFAIAVLLEQRSTPLQVPLPAQRLDPTGWLEGGSMAMQHRLTVPVPAPLFEQPPSLAPPSLAFPSLFTLHRIRSLLSPFRLHSLDALPSLPFDVAAAPLPCGRRQRT